MKAAEIRKLSDEQLVHADVKAGRDYVMLKFKHASGLLVEHSELRRVRRQIALFRTIEREREILQGLAKNALREKYVATWKPDGSPMAVEEKASESKGFLKGIVDKIKGTE